jgi:hypothetical protein
MEHLLYQLVATLLSAHAPWWLLAIVVGTIAVDRIVDRIAIAIDRIGPIRLNLSIGNSTARRRSIDRLSMLTLLNKCDTISRSQ